jgi:potassium-dependent mechanosensitive channel
MGIPRTATVKAVTPTTVFVIGRSQLKKLMQNHPNLAEQIALKLSERKQTLIDLGILHKDYQNHKQSVVIEWVRSHLASLFGVQFHEV